jgi:hypothetical protein
MSEEHIGTLRVYCSCGVGAPPVVDSKFIRYDKPAAYVKAVIRYRTWWEWFCIPPSFIDVNIEYKVQDKVYWFKNVKGEASGTEVIQLSPDVLNKMHQLSAWGAHWLACWPVEVQIDLYAVAVQPTPPTPTPSPTPTPTQPPGGGDEWSFSPWLFVFMVMMMAMFMIVVALAVRR